VEGEVAVKGGHYGLEEGAEGGGAGDTFAGGLQEDGVQGIELQDGFELFGAKVLDPGFADSGEGYDSRGLGGGGGKCRCEDGGEGQERYEDSCLQRVQRADRKLRACRKDLSLLFEQLS